MKGTPHLALWHELDMRDQQAPPVMKMLQEKGEALEHTVIDGTDAVLTHFGMEGHSVMVSTPWDLEGTAVLRLEKKKRIKLTNEKLVRPSSQAVVGFVSPVKVETLPLTSAELAGNTAGVAQRWDVIS
mmetsp:Transcript_149180/g.263762  ORF Transcript_149180/g.263762 Transcript_149180/m.263762 type:complete len:128 (-) Transcript_149180:44-427(-)